MWRFINSICRFRGLNSYFYLSIYRLTIARWRIGITALQIVHTGALHLPGLLWNDQNLDSRGRSELDFWGQKGHKIRLILTKMYQSVICYDLSWGWYSREYFGPKQTSANTNTSV